MSLCCICYNGWLKQEAPHTRCLIHSIVPKTKTMGRESTEMFPRSKETPAGVFRSGDIALGRCRSHSCADSLGTDRHRGHVIHERVVRWDVQRRRPCRAGEGETDQEGPQLPPSQPLLSIVTCIIICSQDGMRWSGLKGSFEGKEHLLRQEATQYHSLIPIRTS